MFKIRAVWFIDETEMEVVFLKQFVPNLFDITSSDSKIELKNSIPVDHSMKQIGLDVLSLKRDLLFNELYSTPDFFVMYTNSSTLTTFPSDVNTNLTGSSAHFKEVSENIDGNYTKLGPFLFSQWVSEEPNEHCYNQLMCILLIDVNDSFDYERSNHNQLSSLSNITLSEFKGICNIQEYQITITIIEEIIEKYFISILHQIQIINSKINPTNQHNIPEFNKKIESFSADFTNNEFQCIEEYILENINEQVKFICRLTLNTLETFLNIYINTYFPFGSTPIFDYPSLKPLNEPDSINQTSVDLYLLIKELLAERNIKPFNNELKKSTVSNPIIIHHVEEISACIYNTRKPNVVLISKVFAKSLSKELQIANSDSFVFTLLFPVDQIDMLLVHDSVQQIHYNKEVTQDNIQLGANKHFYNLLAPYIQLKSEMSVDRNKLFIKNTDNILHNLNKYMEHIHHKPQEQSTVEFHLDSSEIIDFYTSNKEEFVLYSILVKSQLKKYNKFNPILTLSYNLSDDIKTINTNQNDRNFISIDSTIPFTGSLAIAPIFGFSHNPDLSYLTCKDSSKQFIQLCMNIKFNRNGILKKYAKTHGKCILENMTIILCLEKPIKCIDRSSLYIESVTPKDSTIEIYSDRKILWKFPDNIHFQEEIHQRGSTLASIPGDFFLNCYFCINNEVSTISEVIYNKEASSVTDINHKHSKDPSTLVHSSEITLEVHDVFDAIPYRYLKSEPVPFSSKTLHNDLYATLYCKSPIPKGCAILDFSLRVYNVHHVYSNTAILSTNEYEKGDYSINTNNTLSSTKQAENCLISPDVIIRPSHYLQRDLSSDLEAETANKYNIDSVEKEAKAGYIIWNCLHHTYTFKDMKDDS